MTGELLTTLRQMVQEFNETFIILDALDECKEREELLTDIEGIAGWKIGKLHIVATSRRKKEIEETLEPLITGQICIKSALVDADIQIYLGEALQKDSKLKMWPTNVQKEIQETLMDGAHGMWVVILFPFYNNTGFKVTKLSKGFDGRYANWTHCGNVGNSTGFEKH